jgi:hypothetical protein|tara:strand:- start:515 stop:682 length:168 start_codon:yes stop_codon:yes gene_type:complete
MTRKDFQAIAEIVSYIENDTERKNTAEHFADFLIQTNKRFNKEKFLDACLIDVSC